MIHSDLGRTYCKMNLSEKIKTMNNKINQNKGQFDLEREINMNSPLSSGNVD